MYINKKNDFFLSFFCNSKNILYKKFKHSLILFVGTFLGKYYFPYLMEYSKCLDYVEYNHRTLYNVVIYNIITGVCRLV